jgi:hypothetical protein
VARSKYPNKFIQEEFKRLGYDYQRKTMCTVRMGRKFIPGYKSRILWEEYATNWVFQFMEDIVLPEMRWLLQNSLKLYWKGKLKRNRNNLPVN